MDSAVPNFPENAFSNTEEQFLIYFFFKPVHSFSCGISQQIEIFQGWEVGNE